MKRLYASALVAAGLLGLGGCVPLETMGLGGVTPTSTQYVASYEKGTVQSVRYVHIQDNGTGTLVGAGVGAVLGHMIGKGKGRTLATLIGGLAGSYVGNAANTANAEELTVRLDNGRHVVVVVKGTRFYSGERIRIVKQGDRVINVEPL
ncbi:glycine zipper 2TM domain-containing protein [Nitratifractor sp.]